MRASSPTERGAVRRRALAGLVGAAVVAVAGALAGCASGPSLDDARRTLAPTGVLRVAVYPGSPTSLVAEAAPEQMRGMAVDLGADLARQLGVPVRYVLRPRVAEVLAALQAGDADLTLTNATPERAALLDFSAPLVSLELGLLVRPGSSLASMQAFDQAGVRIGVSQGSTSQRTLSGRGVAATLVPLPSLQAAREALLAGQIDAFATNKGILSELADRVPGARLLDGRWGLEHLALGTPKGREAAAPLLQRFVTEAQADGRVQRAAERAGLRGLAVPGAR